MNGFKGHSIHIKHGSVSFKLPEGYNFQHLPLLGDNCCFWQMLHFGFIILFIMSQGNFNKMVHLPNSPAWYGVSATVYTAVAAAAGAAVGA